MSNLYFWAILKSLKEDIKSGLNNNILSSTKSDSNSNNKDEILLCNGNEVNLINYNRTCPV